jgi:hypothetical protein
MIALSAVAMALMCGEMFFAWYLTRPGRVFSPALGAWAGAGVIASLVLALAAVGTVLRAAGPSEIRQPARVAHALVAAIAAGMTGAFWYFTQHLAAVARGMGAVE